MPSGIYSIRNIVNDHIYIGSSKNVEGRIKSHFKILRKNRHDSVYFQRAFNKYGEASFVGELLITCHQDMLIWYEQQFIDQWKPEYNVSRIAGKVEWTSDIRMKLSLLHKGKKLLAEHAKKIADANRGKHRNKPISDETRKKMSEAQRNRVHASGYKFSIESRRKMSDSAKGKHKEVKSLQHRINLSIALKGNKNCLGNIHSASTRAKIAAKLIGNTNSLGRKRSEETIRKLSDSIRIAQARMTSAQRSANTKKGWETRRRQKENEIHSS